MPKRDILIKLVRSLLALVLPASAIIGGFWWVTSAVVPYVTEWYLPNGGVSIHRFFLAAPLCVLSLMALYTATLSIAFYLSIFLLHVLTGHDTRRPDHGGYY